MTDAEKQLDFFCTFLDAAKKTFEEQKPILAQAHGENLLVYELSERKEIGRYIHLHTKAKTKYGIIETRSTCTLRIVDEFPYRIHIVEEDITEDEKCLFSIELRPDGYDVYYLSNSTDQVSYHASFYCNIAYRLCRELTKIKGWGERYFPGMSTLVFPFLPAYLK